MAFDGQLKMSIQDKAGNYYFASQDSSGVWSVGTSPSLLYINTLPDGWNETQITYERDGSYMGIFRSQTNSPYKFSKDARAIITEIRKVQGIQGYGLLSIYLFNTSTFVYDTFYQSELDFKTYKNNMQTWICEIGTLDSKGVRDLHAYGDQMFNFPIWQKDSSGGWIPYYNNIWVVDDGVKLLYNATYISSASKDNPLDYRANTYTSGLGMLGFNLGRWSTPYGSFHTLPNLTEFNIVQNNGTTTYIGNDILSNLLRQGNQGCGLHPVNESIFNSINDSQPYTKNNYSLKNACVVPPSTFELQVAVSGNFDPLATIAGTPYTGISVATDGTGGAPNTGRFIAFVLFEINNQNLPQVDGFGNYLYQTVLKYPLPDVVDHYFPPFGGAFDNYSTPVTITINQDKVYTFGIILDSIWGQAAANSAGFVLQSLQFSIFSNYDYGELTVTHPTPHGIPAPQLNPTVYAAYRGHQLFELATQYLASRTSNDYGFPIVPPNDYTFASTYLSDSSYPLVGDGRPYQTAITSEYCIHDLQGQSYISLSFNQIFDFYKKVWGCGLSVIGDNFVVENLRYFFDNTTMILDLGYDVAEFEIMQEVDGVGANLRLGYSKADTNTDFGVDSFITDLYFNTPASNVPTVMDYMESGITCDQYQKEKARAQRVNQPVGTAFDPANPSSNNRAFAVYIAESTAPFVLPNPPDYPFQPYDPSNTPVAVVPYQIEMYNGSILPYAQASDPTAATAPYINGLYYPDTAQNVKLSPARALQRDTGALIHSVLDNMDSDSLAFRATGIMQKTNEVLDLTGIETNLVTGGSGTVTKEMSDKVIGDLPAQLFKPITVKVKSKYPINMYTILNTNPNGYVRFFWAKEGGFGYDEYRFFITKAIQAAGNGMATEFYGKLTPDMVI